jgi:hypothetical protein
MWRSRFRSVAVLAGGIATPLGAQAWTRDWPQAGDAVRISSNAPSLDRARMTFSRQSNDTLVFARRSAISRSSVETPVALANITRLEMPDIPSTGNGPRIRAAAAGFVLGAAVGGTYMWRSTEFRCLETDTCGEFYELEKLGRALVGGVLGGVVGGGTGWVIRRHGNEKWRTVHSRP